MVWRFENQPRREGTYAKLAASSQAKKTRSTFYLLAGVAFFGWWYVFFISDVFAIRACKVTGTTHTDPIEIKREVLRLLDDRPVWRPWNPRHSWFIKRTELANALEKSLAAELVVIEPRNPLSGILRLKIKEKQPKIIFQSHNQFFWVDQKGIILSGLTPEEKKSIENRVSGSKEPGVEAPPFIRYNVDRFLSVQATIVDPETLKKWSRAVYEAGEAGFAYRAFEPLEAGTNASGFFISGFGDKVLVDLDTPLRPQIDAYRIFKQRQPKDIKAFTYIDVRMPRQVFVK